MSSIPTKAKGNVWEFVRCDDGTYAVFHKMRLLCRNIPEGWFEEQICSHYGFCGQQYSEIHREIEEAGRCIIHL